MNTMNTITARSKRLLTHMALGLFTFAPLFGTVVTAQADPPDRAPAWGYRNKDDKGKKGKKDKRGKPRGPRDDDRDRDDWDDDNDDRWDRDRDRDHDGDTSTTVQGVVVNDRSGNDFDVRLNSGQVVRVRDDSGEPANLSVGDRVLAHGYWDRGIFHTNDARILSQGGGYGGGYNNDNRTTVQGIVVRDVSGNDFELRLDSGQIIRVRDDGGEPNSLSAGDRVIAHGYWQSGVFHTRDARIVREGGSYGGGNNDNRTTVQGIVVNDRSGNDFDVRLNSGQVVRVRDDSGEPNNLTVGDRIVANGYWQSGVFHTNNTRIVYDDDRPGSGYGGGYNNNLGQPVNFNGTVESNSMFSRTLRVRGDNGQVYDVRTDKALTLRRNDRVHVVGNFRDGRVYATSVTRL